MRRLPPSLESDLLPVEDGTGDLLVSDARYGEDAAAAAAPAAGAGGGGGGGGGGDAAAAGAVVQGIAMGINAVVGGIVAGVDQQNRPDVVAKEQTLRFVGAMNELRRVHEELRRKKAAFKAATDWLSSPVNKLPWDKSAAALRFAPKGRRVCPPLYPRAEVFGVPVAVASPGGHAAFDPECMCPTANCAYKPTARKHVAGVKEEAKASEQEAWAILHNRAPGGDIKTGMTGNTGNIKQITREAVSAWSMLMALDAMSPLFASAGMMAAWGQGIPDLYTPNTLDLLFGNQSFQKLAGQPPDPDAVAGRVPAGVANRALTTGLGLYALGTVPANYTLPLWVYGFTTDEAAQFGSGPTIGQVAAVQAQLWGPQNQGTKFGALPTPEITGLRERLRDLVLTGGIQQVAPAPPPPVEASPEALALQQQAQAGAQLALVAKAKKRNTQIAVGAGAFLALVGGAVWYATRPPTSR